MTPQLPPLAGRVAALALLAGLLGLAWLAGGAPLLERYRSDRETVAFAAEQLPRLRRLAAEMPALRAEMDRAARDPAGKARLLGGASEALAGAELQNRVIREAGGLGLALRSAQILPPADEESFRRIGLRVALEGDIVALRRLLYAIETGPAYLFVDNLEIRSRSGGRIVRRRDGQAKATEVLSIRLDVTGFQQRGGE